jgi:hypothetical protein
MLLFPPLTCIEQVSKVISPRESIEDWVRDHNNGEFDELAMGEYFDKLEETLRVYIPIEGLGREHLKYAVSAFKAFLKDGESVYLPGALLCHALTDHDDNLAKSINRNIESLPITSRLEWACVLHILICKLSDSVGVARHRIFSAPEQKYDNRIYRNRR